MPRAVDHRGLGSCRWPPEGVLSMQIHSNHLASAGWLHLPAVPS